MFVERPIFLLKWYYKGAVWRPHAEKKTIYLTFDDGPVPDNTLNILDILDRYNVKATFFCVGENVMKFPDLFKEILRRGHAVGNHTFNHIKGFDVSTRYYMNNIRKAERYIPSKLVRPPYGRIKPSQFKALKRDGYTVVFWDVITRDYNRFLSPKQVMRIIHWYSRSGSIVVFHDSLKARKNTLAVLPEAIEYYQRKGYQFGVLSEENAKNKS